MTTTVVRHPLLNPVETLHGVGPRLAALFTKLTGPRVIDLALHLPNSVTDRRTITTVQEALPGQIVTLQLTVNKVSAPKKRGLPTHVTTKDQTGTMTLSFFNLGSPAQREWLEKFYAPGRTLAVSGKVELYDGKKQMVHPDHVVPVEKIASVAILEPNYPLTANLSPKVLRKVIAGAVEQACALPDWADAALVKKHGWPTFQHALSTVHAPSTEADILPSSIARTRLAYDEMLANQLALAIVRQNTRVVRGKARTTRTPVESSYRRKVLDALPWKLTKAQQRVLAEIDADMQATARMVRLLQGDVGSGKTILALLTMLNAVAAGEQAAIMAPTEILAQQHMQTMAPLAAAAGVRLVLLTGSVKGRARSKVKGAIESGEAHIVIGTHALFQGKVAFAALGCVVIDEQHRFGVEQRVALSNKGMGVDMLVMTATPIPRSLALTYYGDMDVSKLDEKPPGRQVIKTSKMDLKYLDDVVQRVRARIAASERVYWVCPLIEESDKLDLAAAEERARLLREALGHNKVGLMHGRLPAEEKLQVMADFVSGKTPLLVSTTVIEVGVNVPEATVMIIDHAERFGLAQLHQLRGRVGRGDKQSACLLLYQGPLGETARARLKMMVDTDDGFKLAEEDLRLRGAGEVLGIKQSGTADFRIADLSVHQDLLLTARDEAKYILMKDRNLRSPRGQALRLLLRLFSMDHSVAYLKAG